MEEEVQQAKQTLKPHTFTLEVIAPSSDDDDVTLQSALLACQMSKQVASEVERDHERAVRERERQQAYQDE